MIVSEGNRVIPVENRLQLFQFKKLFINIGRFLVFLLLIQRIREQIVCIFKSFTPVFEFRIRQDALVYKVRSFLIASLIVKRSRPLIESVQLIGSD